MSASQLALAIKLRDDARFENFHGEHNAVAASRLKAFCDQPDDLPVVLVCGDSNTGKSHLLQAVCNHAENQGKSALCISIAELEPFGSEALRGLENQAIICLDDLDRIAGKEDWEEAVFHLYNRVRDRNSLLIVSLSDVPSTLPFHLADLISRLGHGLIVQLGVYRDDDRLKILMARADQRGLVMTNEVAGFIMRRAPRRVGELLAILDILDENSLQAQRKLTIPFVKTVMGW